MTQLLEKTVCVLSDSQEAARRVSGRPGPSAHASRGIHNQALLFQGSPVPVSVTPGNCVSRNAKEAVSCSEML